MNKKTKEQLDNILANLNAEKECITELFEKMEPLMEKYADDDESPKAEETYMKIFAVESAGKLVKLAERILYELSIDNLEELDAILKKYKWDLYCMDDLDTY